MADAAQNVTLAVNILNTLPLSCLTEEWVKAVWESDFCEVNAPDQDDATFDGGGDGLVEKLRRLGSALHNCGSDNTGFWTTLVENEISLKTLTAYLSYLMTAGAKKQSCVSTRVASIASVHVYLSLVLVPGSSAFKVFHPQLYETAVDHVKYLTTIGVSGSNKRKRSSTPLKSSQGKRNSRSKRRNKQSSATAAASVMEDMDVDQEVVAFGEDADEDEDQVELLPEEVNRLRKHLHALLVDLVVFLEKFSLRQSLSSSYHTVQVLAELTNLDIEAFNGVFDSSRQEKQCVPALAFKGLQLLCSQLHGHVGSLMNATCKYLLPNLLMLMGNKSFQTISKALQVRQDHAVKFMCMLMKECGDRGIVSIRTLIQHMCTKVTDRAEYRARVSQAVVTLAGHLPADAYSRMVHWFHKLSKHNLTTSRGFAIELVTVLLSTPERPVTEDIAEDIRPYIAHKSLMQILLNGCSDRAPAVRARAITCFGQCLGSRDEGMQSVMRGMVTPIADDRVRNPPRLIRTPGSATGAVDETSVRFEMTIAQPSRDGGSVAADRSGQPTPLHRINLTTGFDPNLSDQEGVFSMLRRRANDEKVNVRKAAIQALEQATLFEGEIYTEQNVEVLRDHCRDVGLSVRKQCVQSLTTLLEDNPDDVFLQKCWLKGVFPLVIDRETTLMEKCIDTMETIILNNIVPYNRSKCASHKLAWDLLVVISQPQSVDQRRYIQKACQHWSRQGKIRAGLVSALMSHVSTDNNAAAWMLLAEIAPAAPKIVPNFLLQYWNNQDNQGCSEVMEQVLRVMKCAAPHISSDVRDELINDLKSRLLKFDSPPELIAVMVDTLAKLCSCSDTRPVNDWSKELMMASNQYLSSVVLENKDHNEDLVVCHLFTLGEVVQLCPGKVPKRVFLLVQSMIATPCISSQSQPSSQATDSQPDHSSQTDSQPDHLSQSGCSQSSQDKSADGLSASQSSQGSQPSQVSTQPLTQFRGSTMSSRVRDFAFLTLGKLCLQNEDLAKKCIAALARELEISTDPFIRNNVVIIMCDLCVRYTTTANHYIGNISSCLTDESALVRKQTLTMITRLLLEDYLKWKGALFYRVIYALLDKCHEIATFCEFCLTHLLIHRHPNLYFQHFMECLFHFNDYREHTVYNRFSQTDRDRQLFSLSSKKNANRRWKLYKFMLDQMSDDHKFQLQSKLCQEILGAMVDKILPLNSCTSSILTDALAILSSKEIKLASLRVRPAEDVAGDEQEMAAVVTATAKKTIITQVLKKNVMENIIPVVMSLKHMMEQQRSSLLKELMLYLRELMKDYKTEIKEILSLDHQLAAEIEFDLRKFEEEQDALRQRDVTPAVQALPGVVAAMSGSPRVPAPSTPALSTHSSKGTVSIGGSAQSSPRVHRTPALKSSDRSPTSKRAPPFLRLAATREPGLAALAVLNSARKLLTKQTSQPSSSDHESTKGGLPRETGCTDQRHPEEGDNSTPMDVEASIGRARKTTLVSSIAGGGKSPLDTDDESLVVFDGVTPRPALSLRTLRAISTPSVAMSNITFVSEGNVTFMPPSPIRESDANDGRQSMRPQAGSKGQHSQTPAKERGNSKENQDDNLLLLQSPIQPDPKPHTWNVTSPAPRKKDPKVAKMTNKESVVAPLQEASGQMNSQQKDVHRRTRSTVQQQDDAEEPELRRRLRKLKT